MATSLNCHRIHVDLGWLRRKKHHKPSPSHHHKCLVYQPSPVMGGLWHCIDIVLPTIMVNLCQLRILLRHFLRCRAVHGTPRRVARVTKPLRVSVAEIRRALHGRPWQLWPRRRRNGAAERRPRAQGQEQPESNEHPTAMGGMATPDTLTRHGCKTKKRHTTFRFRICGNLIWLDIRSAPHWIGPFSPPERLLHSKSQSWNIWESCLFLFLFGSRTKTWTYMNAGRRNAKRSKHPDLSRFFTVIPGISWLQLWYIVNHHPPLHLQFK